MRAQLTEVENSWAKSREEAKAMEMETSSLCQMLKETMTRVEDMYCNEIARSI